MNKKPNKQLQQEVNEMARDPRKIAQALILWVLVDRHLKQCGHRRQCREEQLAWEACIHDKTIQLPVVSVSDLARRFPWLGKDEDANGGDTVDALQELYEQLRSAA